MLRFFKKYLGQYSGLEKAYQFLQWRRHILSDWSNTYLFKSKLEFDTPYGFKLKTRKYIANRMMLQGTFEIEEIDIIKSHMRDADIFVDVGANIGLYTCIARSLGKPAVAIEPQPQNLECLYDNLS